MSQICVEKKSKESGVGQDGRMPPEGERVWKLGEPTH